jgi:hypothetical protein
MKAHTFEAKNLAAAALDHIPFADSRNLKRIFLLLRSLPHSDQQWPGRAFRVPQPDVD